MKRNLYNKIEFFYKLAQEYQEAGYVTPNGSDEEENNILKPLLTAYEELDNLTPENKATLEALFGNLNIENVKNAKEGLNRLLSIKTSLEKIVNTLPSSAAKKVKFYNAYLNLLKSAREEAYKEQGTPKPKTITETQVPEDDSEDGNEYLTKSGREFINNWSNVVESLQNVSDDERSYLQTYFSKLLDDSFKDSNEALAYYAPYTNKFRNEINSLNATPQQKVQLFNLYTYFINELTKDATSQDKNQNINIVQSALNLCATVMGMVNKASQLPNTNQGKVSLLTSIDRSLLGLANYYNMFQGYNKSQEFYNAAKTISDTFVQSKMKLGNDANKITAFSKTRLGGMIA